MRVEKENGRTRDLSRAALMGSLSPVKTFNRDNWPDENQPGYPVR
jgi:hypothetical protein